MPLITNDAVVLALLLGVLVFVFQSEKSPYFKKFYAYVPAVLLCYFLPGILNTFGVISGEKSKLYFIASQYLLPASLILFGLSLDIVALKRIGSKAILVFLAGALGVVLGGPIALLLIGLLSPETVSASGADATWRGLATIAGTWIGGAANQAALKEIFGASDKLFSIMTVVDVIVAYTWMAILLYGAKHSGRLDAWLKADNSVLEEVKIRIADYQASMSRIPTATDLITLLALGLGGMGIAHGIADWIAPYLAKNYPALASFSLTSGFFWIVILSATFGILCSTAPRLRQLEGVGASKIATVFLYILIATLGMKMDISAVLDYPMLFVLGFIWISFHGLFILLVARWLKAPFFFVAVGSQAGIGGTASAPVVAAAFHPALAPVGVLLAIFGYAIGTYSSVVCGYFMQWVSGYF
jgi:uncharacterized membrane protein